MSLYPLLQFAGCNASQGLGGGPLTFVAAAQKCQARPRCGVAHPVHQVTPASASIGREYARGVAQVVKMDYRLASSMQSP
jgi:hypothetical protein